MLKELSAELSIVSLRFSRGNLSPAEANLLLAVATAGVPGEVRARYLQDDDRSIVRAEAHVEAVGIAALKLHAVVHVELTYQGDMVRSSPSTRTKINNRLLDLAQRHCAEAVQREIMRDPKNRKS